MPHDTSIRFYLPTYGESTLVRVGVQTNILADSPRCIGRFRRFHHQIEFAVPVPTVRTCTYINRYHLNPLIQSHCTSTSHCTVLQAGTAVQ